MRILFVVKNMRLSNGVASFAMNYYRKLNETDIQFDFLVISDVGSPYYSEIQRNGNKVFILPSYKKNPMLIFPYLHKLFHENKYDILHCNVMNSGFFILMIANRYKVPVRILHSHATQNGDRKWKEIRNKIFCRFSLIHANYYFSCSHLAGDYLFGKDNYYLIPNAIDTDRYQYSRYYRMIHRCSEKCGNKLVVMTAGRFTKQKNPIFIVDIIFALSRLNEDFVFWWFGNGELEQSVIQYAKDKNVYQYIKFWGASPSVNEYYSAADVFILPSLYEGLPVVGIEAQTSGLPVLFSRQITGEIKLAGAVEFLPLSNAELWAEHIWSYHDFDRDTYSESIHMEAFGIEKQCQKLKRLYRLLIEESNG